METDLTIKIYNFLDRHFPITDNVIDITFNENIAHIIENVFGVTNIKFHDWVMDRCSSNFGVLFNSGTIKYYIEVDGSDGNETLAIHRDNDLPAIITYTGRKEWYKNGKRHRDYDLPALIYNNGTKAWYKNNLRHRDNNKPAVIWADGTKHWYQNGQKHRDNDKPAVILADGTKHWYQNGKRHRDNDKPAVIDTDGRKEWYQNGKKHRGGGKPAVTDTDGYKAWYINNSAYIPRHRLPIYV